MSQDLNFYGQPITDPSEFDGEHTPAMVPPVAGLPPACACGWTRFRAGDGTYYELSDHLRDMAAL